MEFIVKPAKARRFVNSTPRAMQIVRAPAAISAKENHPRAACAARSDGWRKLIGESVGFIKKLLSILNLNATPKRRV